jgi:DNA helicase-2/ATP-dependent DNA helicase PcrA
MPREIRVFGPPGTGKTHELATWYIPQAVKQFGPDNVIVCSFTRSAAREIAGRGIEVNEEHVGTLHALCYRILGRPELTQGHLKDWNSLHPGLALSGGIQRDVDEGGDEPDAALTAGDIFHARADIYRARLRPAPMWDSETAAFYKLWTAWKKTNYYVDFTDLIEEALQWHPEFPGRPNVIIVDEAQDFTPLQLKLIRAWGEHCDWIVLSGDDDQCIYNFTGASPHAFIQPEIDPKLIRILGQSYRCPPHITTFSDLWIKTLYNRRQEKPYRSRPGEGKIFYESGNYKFS